MESEMQVSAVRSTASQAGLTAAPYDVELIRADFPILFREVTAVRSSISITAPRRKSHALCWRRWTTPTATNTPTCIAACIISQTSRRSSTRLRGRRCAASSTPRIADEIIFTRNATRRINLVARSFGGPQDRRGRRDRAVDHGASLQHRALALPSRAERRGSEVGADRGQRRVPHRRVRAAAHAAHQDRRRHPDVERARHHYAGQRDHSHRPCDGHSGAGRWQPGRRAHATVDVQDLDADFTSLQATRPTGLPASACSTASASISSRCRPTRAEAR